MGWGSAAGGAAGGAVAGSKYGPVGTGIGAIAGGLNGYLNDPYQDARDEEQKGYDQSRKDQQPYNQNGQDQYGRLNTATGKLFDPTKLQDEWSKNYETSPYAQQLLKQNQANGLDAASSMGLNGSSGALANIQQGAGNIVSKDRQQYMDDLMKKYMAGIGLGTNLYQTGAQTASNMGGQSMTHGENQAGLKYHQTQAPAQAIGQAAASYFNDSENEFNSPGAHYGQTYAGVG